MASFAATASFSASGDSVFSDSSALSATTACSGSRSAASSAGAFCPDGFSADSSSVSGCFGGFSPARASSFTSSIFSGTWSSGLGSSGLLMILATNSSFFFFFFLRFFASGPFGCSTGFSTEFSISNSAWPFISASSTGVSGSTSKEPGCSSEISRVSGR